MCLTNTKESVDSYNIKVVQLLKFSYKITF